MLFAGLAINISSKHTTWHLCSGGVPAQSACIAESFMSNPWLIMIDWWSVVIQQWTELYTMKYTFSAVWNHMSAIWDWNAKIGTKTIISHKLYFFTVICQIPHYDHSSITDHCVKCTVIPATKMDRDSSVNRIGTLYNHQWHGRRIPAFWVSTHWCLNATGILLRGVSYLEELTMAIAWKNCIVRLHG